jgi:hypothetical protein
MDKGGGEGGFNQRRKDGRKEGRKEGRRGEGGGTGKASIQIHAKFIPQGEHSLGGWRGGGLLIRSRG